MAGVKLSELPTVLQLNDTDLVTILQNGYNRNVEIGTILFPAYQNTLTLNGLSAVLSTSVNRIDQIEYSVDTLTISHEQDTQRLDTRIDNLSGDVNGMQVTLDGLERTILSTGAPPVFITDVTNNNGVSQITYRANTVPSNYIVDGVTVDDDTDLDVTLEWDGPVSDWMGSADVNGVNASLNNISHIGNTRRFTTTINVDATNASTLSAYANGASHVVPISRSGNGPEILSVTFSNPPTTNGYQPGFFLKGDVIDITITFVDSDVSSVTFDGNGYLTGNITDRQVNVTGSPPRATVSTTVDVSNVNASDFGVRISAKNTFGTTGNWFVSNNKKLAKQAPAIQSITFGAYPNGVYGQQTELKNEDTIPTTIQFDTNAVSRVAFVNSSSYANDGTSYNVNPANRLATINMRIGTSTTTVQNLPARAQPVGTSNNYGEYATSTDTLAVNNAYPTYSGWNVVYPTGQQALKGAETAIVTLNVSNVNSNTAKYTYTSPTQHVSIPDPGVYSNQKTVTCQAGSVYNIGSSNYKLNVTRVENDASSQYANVIQIANTAPTITVSTPASRLRSGGNDDTTVQTYEIVATSNQRLLSFDMDASPTAGTFDGTWSSTSNNTTWRRNIKISDDDNKGIYNWMNLNTTNLAGIQQTTINSGATYNLGGFVKRTLYVSSQGWQVTANVQAVDYSKVAVVWSKKTLDNQSTVGDTTRPQTGTWSLDRLSPAPITVNILDSGATNASSVETTLTIEEGI